jgi:hypothetical protein
MKIKKEKRKLENGSEKFYSYNTSFELQQNNQDIQNINIKTSNGLFEVTIQQKDNKDYITVWYFTNGNKIVLSTYLSELKEGKYIISDKSEFSNY